MDLQRRASDHDLIDERPEEPLAALPVEPAEPATRRGAEAQHSLLVGLRGPLLGRLPLHKAQALLEGPARRGEGLETLAERLGSQGLVEVEIQELLLLAMEPRELLGKVVGFRSDLDLPDAGRGHVALDVRQEHGRPPQDLRDRAPDAGF